jgi:putative membrane protein
MHNILQILRRDFKRLFKAPAALIVLMALLVLPSIYTWYNVVAFWDPYNSTGGLKVCVVNQDAGADSDVTGPLNVGDVVAEERSPDNVAEVIENECVDENY